MPTPPYTQFSTLNPATHAYSFWEGIPEGGRIAFGSLFNRSPSLRTVTVVQRAIRGKEPAAVMAELGFGLLLLITSFAVNMSGSGASFQVGPKGYGIFHSDCLCFMP